MSEKSVIQYRSLHLKLSRARGRAADLDCTECGGPADEWSYDHSDPGEVTELRPGRSAVRYSLDLARYQPMCKPCHNTFDARDSANRARCMGPNCTTRILSRFDYCWDHRPGARRPIAGRGLDPQVTALVAQRAMRDTDVCITCDKEKPVIEFSRARRSATGYVRHCRPCMSAKVTAAYHRKRAQV